MCVITGKNWLKKIIVEMDPITASFCFSSVLVRFSQMDKIFYQQNLYPI